MIDRCSSCEGEVRNQCDERFATLAQMMIETTDVAALAAEGSRLGEVMAVEGELTGGMDAFMDAQEEAGCELTLESIYERLLLEIQLRPWEQVSGSADQQ